MYLLYVDESCDAGLDEKSPTDYFILSGLVINERDWNSIIQDLIDFRRYVKDRWGVKERTEYKGAHLVGNRGDFFGLDIPPQMRIKIYDEWLNLESGLPIKIINICMRKKLLREKAPDFPVYENAWRYMIQRFNNYLEKKGENEYGMIVADENNEKLIRNLVRKMKVYNPIPKRYKYVPGEYFNKPIRPVIEDPIMRNSKHSYFVQLSDINAYALLRWELQNGIGVWEPLNSLFEKLFPVLLKEASRDNPFGVVYYPKK